MIQGNDLSWGQALMFCGGWFASAWVGYQMGIDKAKADPQAKEADKNRRTKDFLLSQGGK